MERKETRHPEEMKFLHGYTITEAHKGELDEGRKKEEVEIITNNIH